MTNVEINNMKMKAKIRIETKYNINSISNEYLRLYNFNTIFILQNF